MPLSVFAKIEKYAFYNNHDKLIIFYDEGCSDTTLCADGYTKNGLDRFGNTRDYIYPQRILSYNEYKKSYKQYDFNGYDQYGFDRNENNINGVKANKAKILINVFP